MPWPQKPSRDKNAMEADTVREETESVRLAISEATGYYANPERNSALVSIFDNDENPERARDAVFLAWNDSFVSKRR